MPLYAGFDIGGTNARLSVFDASWMQCWQDRRTIRDQLEPEAVAETMAKMLADAAEELERPAADFTAVGVGLAGQLDRSGRWVANSPNLGWRDLDFGAVLEAAIGEDFGRVEVRIVNDLNAILWAEHVAGAAQGVDQALAVYVGTGIGGAMLVDGRLVVGASGKAGEIGHSKVEPGGRLCNCGERGCVEAYAGGVHLERMSAEIAHEEGLDEVLSADASTLADLGAVDALAAEGHERYDELWRRATDYLAIVAANACTLLNPSVLLFGGGVLDNLEDFRGRLLQKVSPLVLEAARDDLEVRTPDLGAGAGMLGAAKLAAESAS